MKVEEVRSFTLTHCDPNAVTKFLDHVARVKGVLKEFKLVVHDPRCTPARQTFHSKSSAAWKGRKPASRTRRRACTRAPPPDRTGRPSVRCSSARTQTIAMRRTHPSCACAAARARPLPARIEPTGLGQGVRGSEDPSAPRGWAEGVLFFASVRVTVVARREPDKSRVRGLSPGPGPSCQNFKKGAAHTALKRGDERMSWVGGCRAAPLRSLLYSCTAEPALGVINEQCLIDQVA